jgi:hypothetical protein
MLTLPTDTAVLFFLRDDRTNLSYLKRAGVNYIVDKALMKANSSCLSMNLQQEPRNKNTGFTIRQAAVGTGSTDPVPTSRGSRSPCR